jgi:hypothetical protein
VAAVCRSNPVLIAVAEWFFDDESDTIELELAKGVPCEPARLGAGNSHARDRPNNTSHSPSRQPGVVDLECPKPAVVRSNVEYAHP